jgi:hypothetical protein
MDRAACERRVYRLATLLSGDPRAAVRVIEAVVDAQPDLRRLDAAHMDRLTVLRSREIPATAIARQPDLPPKLGALLAALAPQQREAWVLERVYRLEPREAARAMDCSVTAGERHLAAADAAFAAAGIDAAAAAAALPQLSRDLAVPAFHGARQRRRRHLRLVRRVAIAVLLLIAAAAIGRGLWWLAGRLTSPPESAPESAPEGALERATTVAPGPADWSRVPRGADRGAA